MFSLALPDPLFQALLILAFLLHAAIMNLVLGGTPVLIVTGWVASRSRSPYFTRLTRTLATALPALLLFAVLLGFVAFLLLMLLYNDLLAQWNPFRPSLWALILPLVALGYGGLVLYRSDAEWIRSRLRLKLLLGLASAAMFGATAMLFVATNVLLLMPDRWGQEAQTSVVASLGLPSVGPRTLHLIFAAIAGTGLMLVLYGAWLQAVKKAAGAASTEDRLEYGRWLVRYGAWWAMGGTLPQIVVGPWLLMSLPPAVRSVLMDGASAPSVIFFVSLTLALLALVLLNATIVAPQAYRLAAAGAVTLLCTMALMAVVRDRVRYLWWGPHLRVEGEALADQWHFFGFYAGAIALFAIALGLLLKRACPR